MSKADMGNDKKLPLFEEKKSDKQKIKEK